MDTAGMEKVAGTAEVVLRIKSVLDDARKAARAGAKKAIGGSAAQSGVDMAKVLVANSLRPVVGAAGSTLSFVTGSIPDLQYRLRASGINGLQRVADAAASPFAQWLGSGAIREALKSVPAADMPRLIVDLKHLSTGKLDHMQAIQHFPEFWNKVFIHTPVEIGVMRKINDGTRDMVRTGYKRALDTAKHGAPVAAKRTLMAKGLANRLVGEGDDYSPFSSMLIHKMNGNAAITGQNLNGVFFGQAPATTDNRELMRLMSHLGKAKGPVAMELVPDMARMAERVGGWHVIGGAADQLWYDKAGKQIRVPKEFIVNDNGMDRKYEIYAFLSSLAGNDKSRMFNKSEYIKGAM